MGASPRAHTGGRRRGDSGAGVGSQGRGTGGGDSARTTMWRYSSRQRASRQRATPQSTHCTAERQRTQTSARCRARVSAHWLKRARRTPLRKRDVLHLLPRARRWRALARTRARIDNRALPGYKALQYMRPGCRQPLPLPGGCLRHLLSPLLTPAPARKTRRGARARRAARTSECEDRVEGEATPVQPRTVSATRNARCARSACMSAAARAQRRGWWAWWAVAVKMDELPVRARARVACGGRSNTR